VKKTLQNFVRKQLFWQGWLFVGLV